MMEALVRVSGANIVRGVIQDRHHVGAAVLRAGHRLCRGFPDKLNYRQTFVNVLLICFSHAVKDMVTQSWSQDMKWVSLKSPQEFSAPSSSEQ